MQVQLSSTMASQFLFNTMHLSNNSDILTQNHAVVTVAIRK